MPSRLMDRAKLAKFAQASHSRRVSFIKRIDVWGLRQCRGLPCFEPGRVGPLGESESRVPRLLTRLFRICN